MTSDFTSTRSPTLTLFAAAIIAHAVSITCFYLYDDAFITFRIAGNLAEGHGFVYNIGERVQGISTPLWGFLLAGAHAVGLKMEVWSRWMGVLLDVLMLGLIWKYFRVQQQALAAMLVVFFFAVDPYLVKNATGGMEAALFLLATVGASLLAMRKSYTMAAIMSALSAFVRPEGLLFALCLLIFVGWEYRVFPWKSLLAGLMIILVGAAVQYGYYGDWIPQSVRGKMALPHSGSGLWSLVFFPLRDPVQLILTITALIGLPHAWKISTLVRAWTIWSAALVLAWSVTGAHLWSWYAVPVWFWKVLVTSVACGDWMKHWKISSALPYVAAAVIVVGWISLAFVLGRDRMETNVYSKLRTWSASKYLNNQRAYGMDFGAFGYYTNLKILDEPGLVWSKAKEYHHDLRSILLGEKPEWAYVTCYDGNLDVMHSPDVSALYAPVFRVAMNGDTALNPAHVSKTWKADFMLFERKDDDTEQILIAGRSHYNKP